MSLSKPIQGSHRVTNEELLDFDGNDVIVNDNYDAMVEPPEHVGGKNIRLDSPHPKELPKNPATPPDMITPESHLLHRQTRLEVYIQKYRNSALNKALSTQYSCGPFGDLSKLVARAKLLLMQQKPYHSLLQEVVISTSSNPNFHINSIKHSH